MENNYNFKMNPSPLNKGDIDKHKDFDALMKRVESPPPPKSQPLRVVSQKSYVWIGGIAAALLIGFLVFSNFNVNLNSGQSTTLAYLESQPYVNPPIESLAEKPAIIKVNANEGGVYEFPSGSRMVVPKAAFANSYGALIEGEVEVHFKEYHDYVDFFLSGIPMEIKVDGQDQILESAGMIEVYATQNGERLQMLPEKPIDIELKSKISFAGETPPDYNIYFLDEEKREWDLRGKDELEVAPENLISYEYQRDSLGNIVDSARTYVSVIGDPDDPNFQGTVTYDTSYESTPATLAEKFEKESKDLDKKLEEEIATIERQFQEPLKPEKPERYDGNSMTMELDFQTADNGAKLYEGTIWQVLTSVDAFDDLSTTVWEDYDLKKLADDAYQLNLIKGEKENTLKVKPVLVGQDYDQAVKQFETQLADYQKEKTTLAAQLAAKKKEVEERIAIEKEMANKSFEEKIAALRAKGHNSYATDQIVKRTVVSKFQITRFGIWNCDRPRPPYLATLDGSFQDQHFNKYQKNVVYQTDKSQNTVRRFYIDDIAKNIQINTDSENLLWLVTDENKLAVFYPDYFNRIDKKEGEYVFEMDLNAQEINSEEDVRRILKL